MASNADLTAVGTVAPAVTAEKTVFKILLTISFCHLLNDTVQSLLPAIYPMLKITFALNYWQIGRIALTSQLTASILQPLVGLYTDRRPQPYSLAIGMGVTLIGLLAFATAPSYGTVLAAAALVGIGSAVFHPESSRVARMASGGQHGMAQSLFQVGGNAGSALGPLLAFLLVKGQPSMAWFSLLALVGIVLLTNIGTWTKHRISYSVRSTPPDAERLAALPAGHPEAPLSSGKIAISLGILVALMFSKFFYLASIGSYYTFYLIDKFHLPVRSAQYCLFAFLASVAAGTIIGGPVGDRIGRKLVIWCSILGVLPFSLLLPHASLFWTVVLSVPIGVILASAFPAIIVYAQELLPGRVGLISGLFFGFAFGMGGIGAAVLGQLADRTSIGFVYQVCAFLPVIGLLTALLPNLDRRRVL
jgi:FSR family fosmidomycin resistance protein-like MFS transporter